ncbi:uncharacterized conserved protein [Longilinea arvoryzae]|uniref:Uncharacterized conserved protein n=1 Tax=Longilinea arvoryzae TaxID=360412 RepID=A0A0S7BGK9_9CHLR|nr:DUF58 domain-containing protein [Longilinea arvoryzae]GAP14733.1 uncharacterized conserved protein [Longilinea arvoryzae]
MAVRRAFWVVVIILIASLAAAYYTPQSVVYQRLAVLIGLVLVVCWLWAVFSIRRVTIRRVARVFRMQLGQLFEERFEITNQSHWARIWFELKDASELPGNSGSRVLSMIGPGRSRSYIARTLLTHRGAFDLGPTIVSSGDPFGLFLYRTTFQSTKKLEVLPYFVELNHFYTPVGLLAGGQALRKKTVEVTPYAAGIREYAPGDSLNRIHWKSTARRDQLMVKEFEQDPQADIWIFLDGLKTIHSGTLTATKDENDPFWLWNARHHVTIPPHTFEYAVSAAASIAAYFIQQGRSVGFAAAGHAFAVLQASRGERQLSKILEMLAFIDCEGQLPLEALVQSQASQLMRGSSVILITTKASSSILLAIEELQRRGTRPIVVLVDSATFGGSAPAQDPALELASRGVPMKLIKLGDDLKAALEQTVR